MDRAGYPYRESLLQWIWQELEFDTQNLRTTCGRNIRIIEPGEINPGAGPDFSRAVLMIGQAKVYGDVEVHIRPEHWNAHNHSGSGLFNRVSLHVAYHSGQKSPPKTLRPDGTEPPLLLLEPYLQKPLKDLFKKHQGSTLPCSGNVAFINQEAFERQVRKAHRFYFEYKTERLLEFYDSHLPLSKAWRKMFAKALFSTLGIPRNRQSMVHLCGLLTFEELPDQLESFIRNVSRRAFDDEVSNPPLSWTTTGMRPQSHPKHRVKQAASLYYKLGRVPFSRFLSDGLHSWEEILQAIPKELQPGSQMQTILHQTVFYPSIYLLGDLLHSHSLKSSAYEAWINSRGGVPEAVAKPFRNSGFNITKSTRKLGLAHQLKRYCNAGNCHKCEVFKKAISP